MKLSRTDQFIYGLWFKLLILYFIMFIMSAIVPITAMFPGLGFPCYFNALVNYSAINLLQRNTAKHLTPTLYLETQEMFFYITFSFIVDLIAAIYYIFGAYAIYKARKQHVTSLTTLSQWITLLGSPTLIYLGLFRLFTIQLFINTLSYKHVLMAAFIYTVHFVLSFIYIQCFISRNCATWTITVLEQKIPPGTLLEKVLLYGKTICVNAHLACLALEMLVFAMSFMMAVGNALYVLVADVVFGAINLYLSLTILWYALTELFLSRYMRYQYGFYVGVLMASIILIVLIVRYEAIFVSAKLHKMVALNVSSIPMIAFIAAFFRSMRLVFAGKSATSYKPVNDKVKQPKPKKKPAPAIMESDSSGEEDIF